MVKWELVEQYLNYLGSQADIDEMKLREEKPIESFQCKINTEYIIVMNAYVDDKGEKQIYDDATITKLIAELEDARDDVLSGKSMKEVAEIYENVSYYESSFYRGSTGTVEIYENAAYSLKPGEVSEIIRDALSTFVIRRLDDTKDADYEEYIKELVGEKQNLYAQDEARELTNNAYVSVNENIWETIGVGKNNS